MKKWIPVFPIAKKIFNNRTPDGAATLPQIINLKGQLKHPVKSDVLSFNDRLVEKRWSVLTESILNTMRFVTSDR
jgi:hypothetical protein